MPLIIALVMFAFSTWFFYRAFTYGSRPPRRWGLTQGAHVCSRFSEVMQALLLLLFSVVFVWSESMSPKFRVMLPLLGFAGVFVGMIYDQYIRKEELDDAQRRRVSSGRSTLSAGKTRKLSELALVTSIIGAGVGYVLAGLISLGAVSPPFVVLQVYIGATAVPWVATILTLNATYGKEFPSGNPDSLKVVLREAPFWAKALPCIALVISTIALISVPASGGSLQIVSWIDAAAHTKGVFFLSSAAMWCIPVPAVVAIRRQLGDHTQ